MGLLATDEGVEDIPEGPVMQRPPCAKGVTVYNRAEHQNSWRAYEIAYILNLYFWGWLVVVVLLLTYIHSTAGREKVKVKRE